MVYFPIFRTSIMVLYAEQMKLEEDLLPDLSLLAYSKVSRSVHVDTLLVDGNKKPDVDIPVHAVVKGDAKIHEIMAASILAKTERDRIMMLCDARWPEYGYAKHKGYPTEEHREAIRKYGPSPIERMTFQALKDETPSLF